jgi:hypothetical protein
MFSNIHKRLGSLIPLALAAGTMLSVAGIADAGNDYRVRARIRTGTRLEAKGDYRERIVGSTLLQRWNVEVQGAAANTTFEVRLNGDPVGLVVTNSLGFAEQEFRTTVVDDNPHDEEPPLPTDFPHINIGDTLTVVGIGTAPFARH